VFPSLGEFQQVTYRSAHLHRRTTTNGYGLYDPSVSTGYIPIGTPTLLSPSRVSSGTTPISRFNRLHTDRHTYTSGWRFTGKNQKGFNRLHTDRHTYTLGVEHVVWISVAQGCFKRLHTDRHTYTQLQFNSPKSKHVSTGYIPIGTPTRDNQNRTTFVAIWFQQVTYRSAHLHWKIDPRQGLLK